MDVTHVRRCGGRRRAGATRPRAPLRLPRARMRRRVAPARAGAAGRRRRAVRRSPSRCCARAQRRHRRAMYRCKRDHSTRIKPRGCRPSRSHRPAGCATPDHAWLRRRRIRSPDRVHPVPRLATAHRRLDVDRLASSGPSDRQGSVPALRQVRPSLRVRLRLVQWVQWVQLRQPRQALRVRHVLWVVQLPRARQVPRAARLCQPEWLRHRRTRRQRRAASPARPRTRLRGTWATQPPARVVRRWRPKAPLPRRLRSIAPRRPGRLSRPPRVQATTCRRRRRAGRRPASRGLCPRRRKSRRLRVCRRRFAALLKTPPAGPTLPG